jgi:hypothetical protein
MKHFEVRRRVVDAYDLLVEELRGEWPGRPLPGYEAAIRHRSKFESCGRLLPTPHGHEVYHWCRRPACPTCATHWGRALGRKLVQACPKADKGEFRMATLVIDIAPDPDAAFDAFRTARRTLANAVDYRRRAKGLDRAGWRSFGLAGALEVDLFEAEDFTRLGTAKREQYRALGFDQQRSSGPQWVATVHALVRVGSLGDDAVRSLLKGVAPEVHLQGLHDDQTLVEAAEGVVGYAAKVQITTALACGGSRPWSPERLKDYVASSARCSHGRQGFRLLIKPKAVTSRPKVSDKLKSKSLQVEYDEPMPFVF